MNSITNLVAKNTMPVFLIFLMVTGCINSSNLTSNYYDDSSTDVNWSLIDSIDINQINSDLVNGKPTVDIGIYFPSNLDSTFTKVTFNKMIESFLFAKEIFKPTDVQLNLLFAKTGNINSAVERPNQLVLKAFPLDFVKYLEIVVVAVWDIMPWPENLIKKIAINKKVIDEIFEKKKHEKDKSIVTKNANLNILISSIFFPTQINKKLLSKVADA